MSLYRNEREYALYTEPAKAIKPAPARHTGSNCMRTIAVIIIAIVVGYSLALREHGDHRPALECRK